MKELIERLRTPVSTNAPYEPHYTIPPRQIQIEAADALERLTKEAAHRKQLHEAEVADLTAERDALEDGREQAAGVYKRAAEFLVAENAALKADAERYRWLREQQDVCWQNYSGQWSGGPLGDFDATIDAAVKEQTNGI